MRYLILLLSLQALLYLDSGDFVSLQSITFLEVFSNE